MSDPNAYENWISLKESQYESLCCHCGACCGAMEDPCEHLVISPEGKSSCRVYEQRFGLHKTLSGKGFQCVPVRAKIGTSWPGDQHCGYKKIFS